eukprot:Pgem_evm1s18682
MYKSRKYKKSYKAIKAIKVKTQETVIINTKTKEEEYQKRVKEYNSNLNKQKQDIINKQNIIDQKEADLNQKRQNLTDNEQKIIERNNDLKRREISYDKRALEIDENYAKKARERENITATTDTLNNNIIPVLEHTARSIDSFGDTLVETGNNYLQKGEQALSEI